MTNQEQTHEIAIRAIALDYAEGWYEGDAERMERCLHPNLVKRQLLSLPESGQTVFEHFTKDDLVRWTEEGKGKQVPRDKLYYQVDITEIFQEVAMVRCESVFYVDFLQMVYDGDRWLIVNILYSTTEHFEYE